MATIRNISTSLSAAATVLLQACSSSGSDPATGPIPVANTTAPQLVGSWQSNCIVTQNSGSTTTVTSASGGSGGGSVSGGAGFINTVIFNQDGRVEFITQYFGTSNCNANTPAGLYRYNAVYAIGGDAFANDGSPVTEININDTGSATYSIFQVVSSTSLYLGDATNSTAGMDGSSEAQRYDGLGSRMLKL